MASVLGIVVVLLYIGVILYFSLCHRLDKCQWILFNATIIINVFLGFGHSIFGMSFISLTMFLYIIISLFVRSRNILLSKKTIVYFIILVCVLFASLVHLVLSTTMPEVILMDDSMDSVYYGLGSVNEAVWSHNNVSSFRDIMLMCVGLLLSSDFLGDSIKRNLMLAIVKKSFHIFFIIITFEFIVNNLFSPVILREVVYRAVGINDISQYSKIWTAENRFGYYGVTGFFSEQSYIAVIIIYFAIVYVQGINNRSDLRWFVYSILALIMSGCTTGLMLIGFPVTIYVKEVLHKEDNIITVSLFKFLSIIFVAILFLILIICEVDFVADILKNTFMKINAFMIGGYYETSSERSAAIRYFANSIAWDAFFKSPLLGVGIGTTRGYGILPGLFANFGVLGILAYFMFLKSIFRFTLKSKKILFLILVAYTSILLSVWYAYYFALIPLYAVFGGEAHKAPITYGRGIYVKS